jgi:nucleotide-binding universal stress UspA family protein
MTGWAVTKRLVIQARESFSFGKIGLILGTALASLLTTAATAIIFEERFLEGAWTYLLFIPLLYGFFTYFRNRLGAPSPIMEYLGRLDAAHLAGFGFGQIEVRAEAPNGDEVEDVEISWQPEPIEKSHWREERIAISKIAILLDASTYAAQAIPYAEAICKATGAQLLLLSSVKDFTPAYREAFEETRQFRQNYLDGVVTELRKKGLQVEAFVRPGRLADATAALVEEKNIDMVVTSTRGKSGDKHWLSGGVSSKLMRRITTPVLLVQVEDETNGHVPTMEKIMLPLDGSIFSERSLPYARALGCAFGSKLILVGVPQVPEVEHYRAPAQAVEEIRTQTVANMEKFLNAVARSLREDGLKVEATTTGSLPVRTVVSAAEEQDVDMIMLTSRGRGGWDLLFMGSVAERIVEQSERAVFMVPIHDRPEAA